LTFAITGNILIVFKLVYINFEETLLFHKKIIADYARLFPPKAIHQKNIIV